MKATAKIEIQITDSSGAVIETVYHNLNVTRSELIRINDLQKHTISTQLKLEGIVVDQTLDYVQEQERHESVMCAARTRHLDLPPNNQ